MFCARRVLGKGAGAPRTTRPPCTTPSCSSDLASTDPPFSKSRASGLPPVMTRHTARVSQQLLPNLRPMLATRVRWWRLNLAETHYPGHLRAQGSPKLALKLECFMHRWPLVSHRVHGACLYLKLVRVSLSFLATHNQPNLKRLQCRFSQAGSFTLLSMGHVKIDVRRARLVFV